MKKFEIQWHSIRELTVEIEANTEEEALKKWKQGKYEQSAVSVNDEDYLSKANGGGMSINGEEVDD